MPPLPFTLTVYIIRQLLAARLLRIVKPVQRILASVEIWMGAVEQVLETVNALKDLLKSTVLVWRVKLGITKVQQVLLHVWSVRRVNIMRCWQPQRDCNASIVHT